EQLGTVFFIWNYNLHRFGSPSGFFTQVISANKEFVSFAFAADSEMNFSILRCSDCAETDINCRIDVGLLAFAFHGDKYRAALEWRDQRSPFGTAWSSFGESFFSFALDGLVPFNVFE